MCRIEVQVGSLGELAVRLADAAAVADDVVQRFGSAPSLAVDGGSDVFADAIAGFCQRWRSGCGALAGDAKTLAALLARAGAVYLDVEAAIAARSS